MISQALSTFKVLVIFLISVMLYFSIRSYVGPLISFRNIPYKKQQIKQEGKPVAGSMNYFATSKEKHFLSQTILNNGSYQEEDVQSLFNDNVSFDDPRIIKLIKNNFLFEPSEKDYSLNNTIKEDYSMGQMAAIQPFLDFEKGGFFVECGALDGETRSNTLGLEKRYKWQGLLVEADPKNFLLLQKKYRKSFSINACLNTRLSPSMVKFQQEFNTGQIWGNQTKSYYDKPLSITNVPCFSLHSILIALNRTEIDYFSLDVEGFEFKVLQTIPFDKIYIKVLTVEFRHVGDVENIDMIDLMSNNNFTLTGKVTHPNDLANDYIFVHNSILKEQPIKENF